HTHFRTGLVVELEQILRFLGRHGGAGALLVGRTAVARAEQAEQADADEAREPNRHLSQHHFPSKAKTISCSFAEGTTPPAVRISDTCGRQAPPFFLRPLV